MTGAVTAHRFGLDHWRNAGAGTGDGSSAANAGASALAIKQLTGTNVDGVYWVKPPNGVATQVYCDMNTDGGGWMLVARSHPSGAPSVGNQWGWKGVNIGSVNNYTGPYQLAYYTDWYQKGHFASEMLLGNQANINNSTWGPFIYKRFGGSDNLLTWIMQNNSSIAPAMLLLKFDFSVFNYSGQPGMQYQWGWVDTGTSNNEFTMRDIGSYGYGLRADGVYTTYINELSQDLWTSAGPWGRTDNATDASGNYLQSTGDNKYGGTKQAMLMVR